MRTIPDTSPSEQKQAGMVAIMVTLILMIVISLIVLGFAQISRRNQRQSLDRQLSTQAFYAAETGINDAAELIRNAIAAGNAVPEKPDCASTGGGFYDGLDTTLDTATNVEYTCMMVDASPSSLVWGSVDSNKSIVSPIRTSSGTIDRITMTWRSLGGGTAANCPASANNVFSNVTDWTTAGCAYGVLRFDVVPAAASYDVSSLQTATMSSHVVPIRPGGAGAVASVAYNTTGASNRVGAFCSDSNCSLSITFASPQSSYYIRMLSLYKSVSMVVTASSGGTPVELTGSQAMIDVTGKAEDVLRRVQVRLPLAGSSTNQLSDYGLAVSRPICKRFSIMDGDFSTDVDTLVPGVAAVSANPLCANDP